MYNLSNQHSKTIEIFYICLSFLCHTHIYSFCMVFENHSIFLLKIHQGILIGLSFKGSHKSVHNLLMSCTGDGTKNNPRCCITSALETNISNFLHEICQNDIYDIFYLRSIYDLRCCFESRKGCHSRRIIYIPYMVILSISLLR